jgi:hypothetical protein
MAIRGVISRGYFHDPGLVKFDNRVDHTVALLEEPPRLNTLAAPTTGR